MVFALARVWFDELLGSSIRMQFLLRCVLRFVCFLQIAGIALDDLGGDRTLEHAVLALPKSIKPQRRGPFLGDAAGQLSGKRVNTYMRFRSPSAAEERQEMSVYYDFGWNNEKQRYLQLSNVRWGVVIRSRLLVGRSANLAEPRT